MATLSDIRSGVYVALGEPSDSIEYSNSIVDKKINNLQNMICKGRIIDIRSTTGTPREYIAWHLPFTWDNEFYTNVPKARTTWAIATSDTTISFNTDNFSNDWYLLVNGDIVKYTGKTANEVTGVTGIDVAQNDGVSVEQLFTLPSDITKPFTFFVLKDNWHYEIPYIDSRYPTQAWQYFSIVHDKNDNVDLLRIKGFNSETTKFRLNYYKNSTNLTDDNDISVIPDPYAEEVLIPLVAGYLLREQEEIDDANTKLSLWYGALNSMYNYYSSMNKPNRQTIKVSNMDFRSVTRYHGSTRSTNCDR